MIYYQIDIAYVLSLRRSAVAAKSWAALLKILCLIELESVRANKLLEDLISFVRTTSVALTIVPLLP